jgi:hypothetical protein
MFRPALYYQEASKNISQKADRTIVFALSWREITLLKYFRCSSFGKCIEIQLLIASKIQSCIYNFELLYEYIM